MTDTTPLPDRLLALEQKVEEIVKTVGALMNSPAVGGAADIMDRVVHVLQKYFPHDLPEPPSVTPGSLGFSPFDNSPVIRQNSDGTDSDAAGMRWPRNKTRQTL